MLYPEGLTRAVQLGLGALVMALNLAVYFVVWRRARNRRLQFFPERL